MATPPEDALVDWEQTDELPSDEHTLLARIPIMAGSSKKWAYLAFRSTGFNVTTACQLAGTNLSSVYQWRRNDPVFAEFESTRLKELQDSVGPDLIKFDFMRTMKVMMHIDFKIVSKALTLGLDSLTAREYDVYKDTRKNYTPAAWLAIEKVLAPEKHKDNGPVHIHLEWGNRTAIIEGEATEVEDVADFTEAPDEASNLLGM